MDANKTEFDKLFYMSPQPMWVFEPGSLRFLEVNDAAVWHYGYSKTDFMAMTIKEIRPKEDLPAFNKWVADLGGDRCYEPSRHCLRDGSLRDVQVTCYQTTRYDEEAYLVVPVALQAKEPALVRLYELINKVEFKLLQQGQQQQKRIREMRMLLDRLQVSKKDTERVVLMSQLYNLLSDIPGAELN